MSTPELAGRVAIVTGAARGIGAAISVALASRRASLFLLDIDREPLEVLASSIRERGGVVEAGTCDVRSWTQVESAVRACEARFGVVDIAIANAALVEEGAFESGDPARYRDVIETNLIGVINTARAVAPSMCARASGHIVLLSSVSGRETYVGQPVYIASKWAVVGFGRSLRKELLAHGVQVTLIEPGLVDTDMARSGPLGRRYLSEIRALDPDDVARAVLYALEQPPNVAVNELVVQPRDQAI